MTLNNGELLKLLKQKRLIENEMRLEALEEERFAAMKRRASSIDDAPDLLRQLERSQRAKSHFKRTMEWLGLDPTLEHWTVQLLKVNLAIGAISHRRYQADKVFVMFNEEHSQRRCLESMCVGIIPAMMDSVDVIETKYLFKGNLLHITEAPEPSSIQYEHLDRGAKQHAVRSANGKKC